MTTDYNEIIRQKNTVLAYTFFICILLRAAVNAYFVGVGAVISYAVVGAAITAILILAGKKIPPVIMMYAMVFLLSGITIAIMIGFPGATNYMMIFMNLFFVVIYEDIRPIVLQSVIDIFCLIIFFLQYQKQLQNSFTPDVMAMSVVYVISGMLVYISLCRISKKQLENIQKASKTSEEAKKKAEGLLGEIGKSVDVLGNTSHKINESVTVTGDISNQIAAATEDVARRSTDEVSDTEEIRTKVENGVEQIHAVSETSAEMVKASDETNQRVSEGGKRVADLKKQMMDLNTRMSQVTKAISSLNDENQKIAVILSTLDEITEQTNLLSLNASIEAARAGEQGKGFAVVATEIRKLSENSSQFTNEIHEILDGIQKQTTMVKEEIDAGKTAVDSCTQHAGEVDQVFQVISGNTSQVYSKAINIEERSQKLDVLLGETLKEVNGISENIESTSAAMEEISASIANLNGNISNVVDGYNDINSITGALQNASNQN